MTTTSFTEPDAGQWKSLISSLSQKDAAELAQRASGAPLFAHAYSFHLNFRYGTFRPLHLLEFTATNKLHGVKIHVEDGEEHSLLAASDKVRQAFGDRARDLGLIVHIETRSTAVPDLVEAVAIAHATQAKSLRVYPRYEANVSEIISRTIADLKHLSDLDPEGLLFFTLEQHEDLTSSELVQIVEQVANPRLSLLFDFSNMITAYERPLEALRTQAQYITEIHIRDCIVRPDRGGWAQTGCVSGTGDMPYVDLLVNLLLLGRDAPQVTAYALEEEVGYDAPAMRFPDEPSDPFIPFRTASFTPIDQSNLAACLERERMDAINQIKTVREYLAQIEKFALSSVLKSTERKGMSSFLKLDKGRLQIPPSERPSLYLNWLRQALVNAFFHLTAMAAFRLRRWRGALLPMSAKVRFDVLEPEKRPVNAVADGKEALDVLSVEISNEPNVSRRILFDPGHGLEERFIRE